MNMPISLIIRDAGTQQRKLDPETVEHYRQLMVDGVEFPPVHIVSDGLHNWLVDGFHRVEAAAQAGKETVAVNRTLGSLKRAIWESFAANRENAKQRTMGEISEIVRRILKNPEWRQKSQQEIANHVGCSQQLVSRIQLAMERSQKHVEKTEPTDMARRIKEMRADIGQFIRKIHELRSNLMAALDEQRDGWQAVNRSRLKSLCDEMAGHLRMAQPHRVCPYCRGEDSEACEGCRGLGWVHKLAWDAAPEELKVGLE